MQWLAALVVFATFAFATCALVWRRARNRRASNAERAARPDALADARLYYMEKLFRIREPIPLVARLDRAYLGADGAIVLVELKTRWNRAYQSDLIQLSAQKMALEEQTGKRVAAYAFVTVQKPTKAAPPRSHRVELMAPSEIVALYRRRQGLVTGRITPRYARSSKACSGCAFRFDCDRPGHVTHRKSAPNVIPIAGLKAHVAPGGAARLQ